MRIFQYLHSTSNKETIFDMPFIMHIHEKIIQFIDLF